MVLGLTGSSELKIKVTSEKDCLQTIQVEWPLEKVREKIEQAFLSVQNEAKIPGFRPGKSPLELIKKTFQDTAYARAQDILLREGVMEALKTKKINPIQTPVVESADFNPEKPFQFEFHVEVSPKFKLSGTKGMKLTKTEKVITDADLQKSLDHIVEINARLVESKADVLTDAHFAVVDYEGFLEGKPIEGAKAKNFLIDMSAPQAIVGLAEGLKSVKVGEEKDIPVSFPEDSPAKDLAGKQAIFKVKLIAIKEKKNPNLDDELAKDMGFGTLEELKTRVRANLEKEAVSSARRDLEKQIIDHLLEENKFVVPASLIDQQVKHLVDRQKDQWIRQGVMPEDQIKLLEGKMAEFKTKAEKDIRLAYVFDEIAETEKIAVPDEMVNARIQEMLARAEPKEKSALEKALRGEYRSRIVSEIREEKIFDLVVQQAKIK